MVLFWKKWTFFETKSYKSPVWMIGRWVLYSGDSWIRGESWHTCIPCKLFYIEQGRPGVLTMRLHGKTGMSGWKNKWFMPIRFGSFRNDGL